jgi:glycerol-3-phosphate O-acyltransferase/dihydroxyacetone phosphate acyltransferase
MAASSLKRKVLGFLGRMAQVIPVKRPQDYVVNGTGTISIQGRSVTGVSTLFSRELHIGDSVKIGVRSMQKEAKVVAAIHSDTEATLAEDFSLVDNSSFSVMPKIDQNEVFQKVHEGLRDGRCIGIFPEGGSHDRTDILPLKAGVCLMALGAMAKYHVQVTIICCGLNYYEGHKFRSKTLVNFGVPYKVPFELAELYLKDRRSAVAILLKEVERRLRDVWITAENFEELQLIINSRRLFRHSKEKYTPERKMEMNKSFNKAYKYLKAKYGELEDVKQVSHLISKYNSALQRIGVKDSQVRSSHLSRFRMVIYSLYSLVSVVFRLVFVLPSWVFIGIIGVYIRQSAEKERVKALAHSEVKLTGRDVLASSKIILGIVLIPVCSGLIGLLVGLYFGCKF